MLGVLATSGCTSARRRVEGDIVHKVTFEMPEEGLIPPFSEPELQSAMAQKESGFGVRTPGLTWASRPVTLDRDMLDADAYRIETWLAHHGYFDARVEGWRIMRKRPQRFRSDGLMKKAGVVVVVGRVTFGEPSLVDELDVAFTDEQADQYWRSLQEGLVKRTSYVQPGQAFNLDYVDYAVSDLVTRMQENGYAYADAQASIDAYPEDRQVDVRIEATTGPPTTIGPIRIQGADRLSEEQIREVLDLDVGAKMSRQALREAQQRLIGTDVFNFAQVEPDLSDSSRTQVPIDVRLREGAFGRVRSGAGAVYDGTTITPRVRADVTHTNLDGDFLRFHGSANAGLGIPLQGGLERSRFLWGFSLGLTKPRAFGKKWDTSAELSYQRDLLSGQLLYSRARLKWGVVHRASDDVTVYFGPSGELTRLGAGSLLSTDEANLSELDKLLVTATYGGDPSSVRNPFLLPILEGRLTIDWRKGADGADVALDPRGGYYYQLSVRQAVPFRSDDFRFTDIYGEARFYRSFLGRKGRDVPYTAALRLRGQVLPYWGEAGNDFQDDIPYSERVFLGGSQDIRSFRINQVGPYDCVCLAEEEALVEGPFWPFTRETGGTRLEPNPTFLPRGGRISALVSGELRRRWPSGRGVALFGDVGVLARSYKELAPANLPHSLRWGAGIGFRQQTPVGPIRFDLAARPVFPEDGAPMRSDALNTTSDPADPDYYRGRYYGCDDIPDARLPERATGIRLGDKVPIVFNLAIAIGEAL